MPVTLDNLEKVFTYQSPNSETIPKYNKINAAAAVFAQAILENTPSCADQTAAIRLVREARMTANAAIALEGLV
jgi:hypothetical protein